MATFTSGHLHIERHALNDHDVSYDLNLEYDATTDPSRGRGIQFRLQGSAQDKPLDEQFWLPKEEAYNFARDVTKILGKHGISKEHSSIGSQHKYYDQIFEDIRQKLDMHSGDPVDPKHFE